MHSSTVFQREKERGRAKCDYNALSKQLFTNTQCSKCHHNQLKVYVVFAMATYREYHVL